MELAEDPHQPASCREGSSTAAPRQSLGTTQCRYTVHLVQVTGEKAKVEGRIPLMQYAIPTEGMGMITYKKYLGESPVFFVF